MNSNYKPPKLSIHTQVKREYKLSETSTYVKGRPATMTSWMINGVYHSDISLPGEVSRDRYKRLGFINEKGELVKKEDWA